MKVKKSWLSSGVVLGILCAFGLVSSAAAVAPAHDYVQKHQATATITAQVSADQKSIEVPVAYSAVYRTWHGAGRDKDFGFKKIRAIQVLIDGTSRQVRKIHASKQGQLTISIPLSSLSSQELAKPLRIQAKTYTKISKKGKPKHVAASSSVVTLQAPAVVTWNPSSLSISGLAGTTVQANVSAQSKRQINAVSFHASSNVSSMLTMGVGSGTSLAPNVAFPLPLDVTISAAKAPGTYHGTIQLRQAGNSISTLPVTIIVTAATDNNVPQSLASASDDRIVDSQGDTMVKDEIDVGLKDGTPNPDQRIEQIAAENHAVILGSLPDSNIYQLRFAVTNPDELQPIRDKLAALADVAFASRSFFAEQQDGSATPPNDPLSGAWDENNPDGNNWGLEYIKAPTAWHTTTGGGVRIGVVDNGFDLRHEDLKDEVAAQSGFDVRTQVDDWHGNFVSGVICATGNNGVGIVGVNWRCKLGMYATGYEYLPRKQAALSIAAAMEKAVHDNMRIVNLSLGYLPTDCTKKVIPAECQQRLRESDAAFMKIINEAKQQHKDMLWVFSAGNENVDVKYESPADLAATVQDNTMTVAAISKDGTLWKQSKKVGSNFGAGVTVAAPGNGITSTFSAIEYPKSACVYSKLCGAQYITASGTSGSAPFVSGLAGLVLSAHSNFTAQQVRQCIVDAAQQYGTKVPGYGFSVITAPAAVACQPQQPPCIFSAPAVYRCESTNPNVTLQGYSLGDSSACTYSARLDWGDSVIQNLTLSGSAHDPVLNATHRYAEPGTYTIQADIQQTSGSGGVACLVYSNRVHLFVLHAPGS